LKSAVTYFTGGFNYSVPLELSLTYILVQLRFIFFSFVITYYFTVPYTVITMALAVILADMRFYIDFNDYIEAVLGLTDEEDDEYDE
jgi:hypothetical protein